jgi:hypothetical protein
MAKKTKKKNLFAKALIDLDTMNFLEEQAKKGQLSCSDIFRRAIRVYRESLEEGKAN